MSCQNCLKHSRVLDSTSRTREYPRHWETIPEIFQEVGIVYRKRKCQVCGTRYSTVELKADVLQELLEK